MLLRQQVSCQANEIRNVRTLRSLQRLPQAIGLPLAEPEQPLAQRYNVPPGTFIKAVRHADDGAPLVMTEMWWGYRPHWAGEKVPEPINATVEKVATSNYFKGAFAHHRCLVPADGWFEWVPINGKKQPHYLCRGYREPLWLEGIWAKRADGTPGFAIITEPAHGATGEVHPRMPLALDAESLEPWLDPHLTDRFSSRSLRPRARPS